MLTQFDKELLNLIQTDLPIDPRPFAVLAQRLGADEKRVLESLRRLRNDGYIRRIGPFFDSARLGYVSTLVAVKTRQECITSVAEAINSYPGVTHNYERDGEYNLWFALLAPSVSVQERILGRIRELDGVEALLSLPATKKYKVSVQFKLE